MKNKKNDYDIRKQRKSSQKITQIDIYNTIISVPTRSGKGISFVRPTLLDYPGSEIILDFKIKEAHYA